MKQKIDIDIEMSGVLEQINVKAYYTGKGKTAEEDPTAVISDIIDEDNTYIVMASLAKAVGSLQGAIGAYAPNSLAVSDTALAVTGTITMASNFDSSAVSVITSAIRQYCENAVLYDWFAVTTPADTEHYIHQMAQAMSDLRASLRRRVRPKKHDNNEGKGL